MDISLIFCTHSGKSATLRESNHGSGVCKEHFAYYYVHYVPKSSILLAGTRVWKIIYVACGLRSIKIDYFDYPKSLISRINKAYVFFNQISKKHKLHLSHLFCCNHTCYCVNMVSVTSALRYITLASHYHQRYQSGALMYTRGLILRNLAELAEAVQIDSAPASKPNHNQS